MNIMDRKSVEKNLFLLNIMNFFWGLQLYIYWQDSTALALHLYNTNQSLLLHISVNEI